MRCRRQAVKEKIINMEAVITFKISTWSDRAGTVKKAEKEFRDAIKKAQENNFLEPRLKVKRVRVKQL